MNDKKDTNHNYNKIIEKILPKNKEFLGRKKLRLEDIINKSNKLDLSKSNSDESDQSDIELKNYRNLTSGKLNIKNIFSLNNEITSMSKLNKVNDTLSDKINKVNQEKMYVKGDDKLINKLLSTLPVPRKILTDKFECKISNKNEIGKLNEKYKFLANPDSDLITTEELSASNLRHSNFSKATILDVNVNDQIDSNWELKYLVNLNNENQNYDEPSKSQIQKNHLKTLVSDYKKDKNVEDQQKQITSKYSKLSTRSKYGW